LRSIRKYSCSGPQVANTRSAVAPHSFSTPAHCCDTLAIAGSSGVFLSSASPVQLTNAVGITSVTLLPFISSQGGLVGSPAVEHRGHMGDLIYRPMVAHGFEP